MRSIVNLIVVLRQLALLILIAGAFSEQIFAQSASSGYANVTAGQNHTCALHVQGTVWCWGEDGSGQLGNGSGTTDQFNPVQVLNTDYSEFSDVVAITAGSYHTCALKNDTSVWCWGSNGDRQLGNDSSNASESSPVQVVDNTQQNFVGVTAITAGGTHTCAIKDDTSLWCWGNDNSGQLGNDAIAGDQSTPSQVMYNDGIFIVPFTDVTAVDLGDTHSCAIKTENTTAYVWCWGDDSFDQLGNGPTAVDQTTPVKINTSTLDLTNAIAVSAGSYHSCAISATGPAWCWGTNTYGEVGNSSFISANTPALVDTLQSVVAIALGNIHTCAISGSITPTVHCWGDNTFGQLGIGVANNIPRPIPVATSLSDAHVLALGDFHSCALKNENDTGIVYCWGNNSSGQLGRPDVAELTTPQEIPVFSATFDQ